MLLAKSVVYKLNMEVICKKKKRPTKELKCNTEFDHSLTTGMLQQIVVRLCSLTTCSLAPQHCVLGRQHLSQGTKRLDRLVRRASSISWTETGGCHPWCRREPPPHPPRTPWQRWAAPSLADCSTHSVGRRRKVKECRSFLPAAMIPRNKSNS